MINRPLLCTAHDVTWAATGAHCLRCGATARTCFEIRHRPDSRAREALYVHSLGNSSTRLSVFVDAKGRRIE